MMTQSDIVDYLINVGKELNETYEVYQSLPYSLKYNEYHLVEATLSKQHSNISEYMKTSTKILKSYLPHIKKHYPPHIIMALSKVIITLLKY